MTKKQATLEDYEEFESVYDQDFIEQEFINELTEWRENNESSSYRSESN